ncbi:SMP-30/gluconolactonase/LRE family protein [Mycetocola zhadangensis]|uniref:SMP-30/gluconolactonase/LRE family protein n=1 Tax=Mycetocola zhadangensis TaxID=1164595 RepID=A0A3L7J1H4_9MICO|nr:SMP-30/gluconolactonase/LRE family protein [Mycetocola zhadangensis]RLQ84294.1 SMP-30/gluconolactonase/LRE family protein [Mycetocola zhadangensis]GGE94317.1 gluconolactonase [Mycetocola zhadangensis]
MAALEQFTDPVAYHGEGPVWSDSWGGLRFVDMLAGDILSVDASGGVKRMHVGEIAAFVRPRTRGGYVVGLERGIGLADSVTEPPSSRLELWTDPGVRMNEGGCAPDGSLYAGSMGYDQTEGAASLYRIDPTGAASTFLPNVTISNGIDFSPDGTRAYYNDTATGRTDVFDVQDNALVHRRPFADGGDGSPDGLCVDSEGNIWVALNSVGRVRLYAPDTSVLAEIELPVRLVTACTLGGADGRDLFITTSRENLDDPEPEAGAVFTLRADVPGKPVLAYAG